MKTGTNDDLNMSEFSSLKFSQLYLSVDITGSCKLYMLQLTKAVMNTFNTIDACINFINSHSGFTVIGWYKRGIINYQSLIADRKSIMEATSIAIQTTPITIFLKIICKMILVIFQIIFCV